jgi:hypothetical protein
MIGRRGVAAAVVATTLLAAGCTNTKPGPPSTVTVYQTVAPSAARTSAKAAPSSSGRPVTTRTMHKLPGSCEDRLPAGSIDAAVHGRVSGRDVFVVGQPDTSIGRLGYINCQYGVPRGNTDVARVEIQVSLYQTAGKATARIQPTINDYTDHSATPHKTRVAGFPATLLIGGTGSGYGPTALLAIGQRTLVVALRPGAFPASGVDGLLANLAGLAARRTSAR